MSYHKEEYGPQATEIKPVRNNIEKPKIPALLEMYAKKRFKKYGSFAGLTSKDIESNFSYIESKAYVKYSLNKQEFEYRGVLRYDRGKSKIVFTNEYIPDTSYGLDNNPDVMYLEVPRQKTIDNGPVDYQKYKIKLDSLFNEDKSPLKLEHKKIVLQLLDPDSKNLLRISISQKPNTPDNKLAILNEKESLVNKEFDNFSLLEMDSDIRKALAAFKSKKDEVKKEVEEEYKKKTQANKNSWNKIKNKKDKIKTNQQMEEEEIIGLKLMVTKMLRENSEIPLSGIESFKTMYPTVFNDPEIKNLYESVVNRVKVKKDAEAEEKKKATYKAWQNKVGYGGKRKTRKRKNRKSKTRKHSS